MIRSQVFKFRNNRGVFRSVAAGCSRLPSSGSAVRTYGQSTARSFRATGDLYAPNYSMSALKEVRSVSGAPIVECKKALEAASQEITPSGEDDDETVLVQKAMDWLREHGAAKASSKVANRETTEGLVSFAVSSKDPSSAVLVKVASETDFAGRSGTFVKLVESVTQAVLPSSSTGEPVSRLSSEEISRVKTSDSTNKTVQELMDEAIVAIRENISVADVRQLRAVNSSSAWFGYVHNRVHPQSTAGTAAAAVLLEVATADATTTTDLEDIGKKLAMHVVAARPMYLTPDEIPEEILNKERGILQQQLLGSGKPADIMPKIIEGRMRKYYEEFCLLEQSHMVEDGNPKVGKFLEERGIALKQYQLMFIS